MLVELSRIDWNRLGGPGQKPTGRAPLYSEAHVASPRPIARRQGFTLLEVLLAVGISVLAMAAVYAAMEIHLRFIDSGDQEVERAQLARAVLGRIAEDLRSTVFASGTASANAGTASESSSDSLSADGESEPDDASASEDPLFDETETSATETGLFGGPTVLTMYAGRVPRTRDYSPANAAFGAPGGGVQLISYYLAPSSGQASAGGLVRDEADPRVTSLADLQFDSPELPPGAQVIAPEVAVLEFRYFDGVEWLDSWDSAYDAALPRAVEIVLGFTLETESAEVARVLEQERLGALAAGRAWPPVYRLVVALPMADPLRPAESAEEGALP